MNLPELLGSNDPVGRAPKLKDGSDQSDRDDGSAFLSSMNSAVEESRSSPEPLTEPDNASNPVRVTDDKIPSSDVAGKKVSGEEPTAANHAGKTAPVAAPVPFTLSETAPTTRAAMPVAGASSEQIASKRSASDQSAPKLRALIAPRPAADPSTPTNEPGLAEDDAEVANLKVPASGSKKTIAMPASQMSGRTQLAQVYPNPQGTTPAKVSVVQVQPAESTSARIGTLVRSNADATPLDKPSDQIADSLRNSSDAKVEAKADTQASQDDALNDSAREERVIDRRSDKAAAYLKQAEKTSQLQSSTLTGSQSGPRPAAPVSTVVEFGQPATSTHIATSGNLATNFRDAFTDRVSAAVTPSATGADGSARHTIAQIAAAIRNQPVLQTVELSLDPPELGRIEIQMDLAEHGLKATLSAERSGTGDLIRRQAELLLQQLEEAGFSDVDLDFREFGSGKGQKGESGETPAGAVHADSGRAESETTARPLRQAGTNGMDVRL